MSRTVLFVTTLVWMAVTLTAWVLLPLILPFTPPGIATWYGIGWVIAIPTSFAPLLIAEMIK